MSGGSKRGLVAPQNTFLENLIRRLNQNENRESSNAIYIVAFFAFIEKNLNVWFILVNTGFPILQLYYRPIYFIITTIKSLKNSQILNWKKNVFVDIL